MNSLRDTGIRLRVGALHDALLANAHLWDQNTGRTQDPASPHHGLSDIWVRAKPSTVATFNEEHESVWLHPADVLPVKNLCAELMEAVGGIRLGGILITKIKAGKECRPHRDGGWHAAFYEKFAVQVQSAPGQTFNFEGESLDSKPGDVYWFDNSNTHWVLNPTDTDRITMIVCVKRKER